jgi:hypothetical protein
MLKWVRRGIRIDKVGQTDRYRHNKIERLIWDSVYPLTEFVVKEDCGWVNCKGGN